jgi:aryl-alcohol dehydrogenase-like predicted oxidoreductase
MLYRRLGRSGLQVSLFSLGSWVTFHNQVDASGVRAMRESIFSTTPRSMPMEKASD